MSATLIYAVVRAVRSVTINGQPFARGDDYASLRFASAEHFHHFQRNLRWSAFEVVQADEKAVKDSTLATAAKVTVAELAQLDDLRAELEQMSAALKDAAKALDAARKRAADPAAILAELSPEGLSFLVPELAEQVIAQAKERLRKRAGPAPVVDPVAEARAAALKDLMAIDGIGEATATRLIDELAIRSQAELAEHLRDPGDSAALEAMPGISAANLAHWRRQLEIELAAGG